MTLRCGIVGLPNVGKSTIFNAITQSVKAEVGNYPFCTIEPNSSVISVPDERLNNLAQIAGSQKLVPSYIEFVDIAGLVQGASKGEGLGNKFLSHIRQVDAIIHIARCFNDKDVSHVSGKIDPIHDIEIVETELLFSDLESIEKRLPNVSKKAKAGDKESQEKLAILEKVHEALKNGIPAKDLDLDEKQLKSLDLITSKPVLYVCNVSEEDVIEGNEFTTAVEKLAKQNNSNFCIVSAKIESEIALIENKDDRQEFLGSMSLAESGLDKIIRSSYELLDLQSYFTVGPKEAHSWTYKKGIRAKAAAGIIHSDFERGFICADVIAYEDYINYRSEAKIKEAGKLKTEGKDYIVQDGDIINFRFNV